jgi:hypothetical protein
MIGIKGARLESLTIKRDAETGFLKLTGDYSLVSTKDTVLAKQSFNGYSEIKLEPGADARGALDKAVQAVSGELSALLGLV